MTQQGWSLVLALALYVAAGALFIGAAWRRLNLSAAWLLVPLLLIFAGYWQAHEVNIQQSGGLSNTDVWMYTDYASDLFRLGHNPYDYDLFDAFRVNRAPLVLSTPLINGDVSVQYAYPALSFLLFVPFQWLGISTTLVYPLFLLLVLLAVFWGTPPRWRPVVLLPLFLDVRYMLYAMGGVSDITWTFMLVMVILHWRRQGWRAVWFGLACAIKQQPWFLAPFLVIRIWHETRERSLGQRLGAILQFGLISAWICLIVNLPFMIWDFNAWLTGILEPLQANMIVLGQGISSLMLIGTIVIPKLFFTVALLGGVALALLLFWRHFDSFPEAMWLFPGLVFWFGHRSLPSYWYYFALLFIFATVRLGESYLPEPRHRDWRLSGGLVLLAGVFIAGGLLFFSLQPAKLSISVNGPLETAGSWVMRAQVQITNNSGQPITPRFSVQSGNRQPMFWHIDQGPDILDAGTSADFIISTDTVSAAWDTSRGGLIAVSDATQYDIRATTSVSADTAARYYDALPNGAFAFWDINSRLPASWGTLTSATETNPSNLIRPGDRVNAVHLTLPRPETQSAWTYLKLDTWIPIPQSPLQVWVKPPANANQWPSLETVYGYELYLANTDTYIWVLFGAEHRTGQLAEGTYYWMLPAPVETWSLQSIDPAQIIAALGLNVPLQTTERFDMTLPARMINLRLLLAARATAQYPVEADFGAISPQTLDPANEQLVQEAVEQPELVHIWHGDYNYAIRNYDEAIVNYSQAIADNAQAGMAYYGLGLSHLALQDWSAAESAFELALATNTPEQSRVLIGMGWAHYHLGELEQARQAYEQALYILSNDPVADRITVADAYAAIGWVLIQQQECDVADAYFQYAQELDSTQVDPIPGTQGCKSGPMPLQPAVYATSKR